MVVYTFPEGGLFPEKVKGLVLVPSFNGDIMFPIGVNGWTQQNSFFLPNMIAVFVFSCFGVWWNSLQQQRRDFLLRYGALKHRTHGVFFAPATSPMPCSSRMIRCGYIYMWNLERSVESLSSQHFLYIMHINSHQGEALLHLSLLPICLRTGSWYIVENPYKYRTG